MEAVDLFVGFATGTATALGGGDFVTGTATAFGGGSVLSGVGDALARNLAPGPGAIGRTGSKYCERPCRGSGDAPAGGATDCSAAAAVAIGDEVAAGEVPGDAGALGCGDEVALGVALGFAVTLGDAVADAEGEAVALGATEALALGDTEGDGDSFADAEGEGVGVAFFLVVDLLRCFGAGVGVGLTKSLLILSPSDSSSAAPRGCALIAIVRVIPMTSKKRVVSFIPTFA